jgi:hypothetical protein
METEKPSRYEELDETMTVREIDVDIQTLLNILTHASEGIEKNGWGKLLGYFDPKTQNICLKESYPLVMSYGEKIKKDAKIEKQLEQINSESKFVYRQIGFYIISNEYEYFTSKVMNYLINNDCIKAPNVFLYFDLNKAQRNEDPWNFYEPSAEFNKICVIHRIQNNSIYEVDGEKFEEFQRNKSELFNSVKFNIKRSPVFDLMVLNNSELLEKIFQTENKPDNEIYVNEMISGINELVFNKNSLMSDKKQTISHKMNLYGSLRRNLKLKENKKIILDDLKQVIEKYAKKCSN